VWGERRLARRRRAGGRPIPRRGVLRGQMRSSVCCVSGPTVQPPHRGRTGAGGCHRVGSAHVGSTRTKGVLCGSTSAGSDQCHLARSSQQSLAGIALRLPVLNGE
jgi:hypothetical protein